MLKQYMKWAIPMAVILSLLLPACAPPATPTKEAAPTEEAAAPTEEAAAPTEEAAAPTEEAAPPEEAGCPASTVADPMGLDGAPSNQFELAEYQSEAGCELTFSENPNIAALNAELNGADADLPPVAERLPSEPLVVQPYFEIGTYGGCLRGISKSPESGTSDFLSTRHVTLFRYAEDLLTIVPYVAKGWEYNDDYTELTIFLREGHKWSDGAPFTAEDIVFWYNDIKLNEEYYENVESVWLYGGEPAVVEAVNDTTVKFTFTVPAPNFVTFVATVYRQPFQPKHVLSQFHPKYNPNADEEAKSFGFDGWVERFRLYYHDWKDTYHPLSGPEGTQLIIPTLESHVLVEETAEGRRFVANPYFFAVDTAGNQLPYIDEQKEIYSEDIDVTILKLINGEIDYKQQNLQLPHYPELKENEAGSSYRILLRPAISLEMYYSFNITHKDAEKRKIYGDLRFRQAMSLAMNRDEINEIVYLGQGVPMQALPADFTTTTFVEEKYVTQFTEYDPDRANELLDEMGLTERDSDGFRLRFDGEPLVVLLQYCPQGGPTDVHELAKGYWEAVGVRTEIKEVTSDVFRAQKGVNEHDLDAWVNDYAAGPKIAGDTQIFYPPFGIPINKRTGILWDDWVRTEGAEGIEPPEDILRLYDLAVEFTKYPLGSEESNRIGAEVVKIHAENLISIGIVGQTPAPIYVNNRVGNFGDPSVKAYTYYWIYPWQPVQWFIKE